MITQQMIPIDHIRTGRPLRKNPGDLRELAASIRQLGQLHPIVIDTNRRLISGWRRLQALKLLGLSDASCTIVETCDEAYTAIVAERADQNCQHPFSISEAVEAGRRIESLARPRTSAMLSAVADDPIAHRQHHKDGTRTSRRSERARESRKPKTIAARAVGMSRPTYEKAAAVVDGAKKSRRVRRILNEMNRTGNVSRAHRQMRELTDTPTSDNATTPKDPTATQVVREIGAVVDRFISSSPGDSKFEMVVSALSDSLARVEKEKIG